MRHSLLLLLLLFAAGCGSSSFSSDAGTLTTRDNGQRQTPARSAHTAPLLRSAPELDVRYSVTSDWGSGFGAELKLTNKGQSSIEQWAISFDYPYSIGSIWNATAQATPTGYELRPASWNSTIESGQTVTIGWNGSPGNATLSPTNFTVNGEQLGTSPEPSPEPTPAPAPDPTPDPSPDPTPEPTPVPGSEQVDISYRSTSDWGSGFGGEVMITNNSGQDISDWTLKFDLAADISSVWNVTVASHRGTTYEVRPAGWQATIPKGRTASFGFNASPGNLAVGAHNFVLSSDSVSPSPQPTPDPQPTTEPEPEPEPVPGPSLGDKKVVAYFPEWGIYARNYNVTDIPAEHLSAVIYAFADISAEGKITLFDQWAAVDKAFPGDSWDQPLKGNFHQLRLLKQKHPHLKVLIAVGGWTLSGRFSDVALTQASREKFAVSVADFVETYGFDGVDIDWEYPVAGGLDSNLYRPQDKQNYTLLLQALRSELDERGNYLLTAALPVGPDKVANHELKAVAEQLDWINLMTYDLHGAWENQTGHQAGLRHNPASNSDSRLNVEWAVDTYLNAGVPAEKIVVGIPAYGRSWANTTGMFQPASGNPPGTFDNTGVFDYKDIVRRLRNDKSTYQRFWDAVALAPWVFAPSLSGGSVITYEDTQSLSYKLEMIDKLGLGGAMMWDLSSDLPVGDEESLIRKMSSKD